MQALHQKTLLLATDLQGSVLNVLDEIQPNLLAYTPYGHRPAGIELLSRLAFNGERPDPVTGHYHLGNGYRQFNPVLMRFNSPDSWSPFGKGGLNTYAYCSGNPVYQYDPTGHALIPVANFNKIFRNAYERVTNRKTYRPADFFTAKNEIIEGFGGNEKIQLLANDQNTAPEKIIARALAEKPNPTRLANFKAGDDPEIYLEKSNKYVSELAARRNTNRELLKHPLYSQHLSPEALQNIKLNQADIKSELRRSIIQALALREPGPDSPSFDAEKLRQATIRRK